MPVDLSSLNPEQYEAVNTTEGVLRVLAGAGSGKTRVITYRIAHIIEDLGEVPGRILAFTFTNKAANEMKERLVSLIGDEKTSRVWCGTMHSIFAKILRSEAAALGYTSHFVICDEDDTKSILNKFILPDIRKDLFDKRSDYHIAQDLISQCKNNMLLTENEITDYVKTLDDADMISPKLRWAYNNLYRIFDSYNKYLKEHDMMDFDDLLIKTVELFKAFPDTATNWSEHFKYILVDEFQDTNAPQFLAIQSLATVHKNLCVVGDDDQSIYGWRGARPEIIIRFESYFKDVKTVKLERNYRSSGLILDAANAVIVRNRNRTDKILKATKEWGEPLKFKAVETNFDIGAAMVHDIIALGNYAETAVLYRNNRDSSLIEKTLIKSKIPYTIVGGTSFYARSEIKDALSYLRLVLNGDSKSSDPAFLRVCNVPSRKLGNKAVAEIEGLAGSLNKSFLNAAGLHAKGFAFYTLISSFRKMLDEPGMTLSELTQRVIKESGLFDMYYDDMMSYAEGTEEYDKAKDRVSNLAELVTTAEAFAVDSESSDIREQLAELLDTAVLAADASKANEKTNCVRLMTVHKAKGLEFDHVLIGPCCEGKFPSTMMTSDVEEERRLMYVAITRARKTCGFYYPFTLVQGKDRVFIKPSRFLSDIPSYCWSESSAYALERAIKR